MAKIFNIQRLKNKYAYLAAEVSAEGDSTPDKDVPSINGLWRSAIQETAACYEICGNFKLFEELAEAIAGRAAELRKKCKSAASAAVSISTSEQSLEPFLNAAINVWFTRQIIESLNYLLAQISFEKLMEDGAEAAADRIAARILCPCAGDIIVTFEEFVKKSETNPNCDSPQA